MQRRDFLKTILAAGVFPLLPGALSAKGYAANGKVRLAAIGCGAQAWFDLQKLSGNRDLCEVVALCDTDIGAKHTRAALRRFPQAPRFQDFRRMFDAMADRIDAVLVGTPDHSHFAAAMHAMRLGKHVYVEKPLAHSFLECELLRKAEKKYGVVCQLGNQGHSGDNYSQYKEYAEKGVIKDVTKIVAHMNMERRKPCQKRSTGTPGSPPRRTTTTPRTSYTANGGAGSTTAWAAWATGARTSWTPSTASRSAATCRPR